jgi:dTDP-4-dehydrorhamnose 3,5-epimerase
MSDIEVSILQIPDVKILTLQKHGDSRGFLTESYNKRLFEEVEINIDFVQDNHVFVVEKGTVRGLHFQTEPFAQDKLVRVPRGAIFDVVVDIRVGSPTYGQHVSAVISAENWSQIFVPTGFAHGLVTLEPNTEILYKVSNYYSPEHDKGIYWNDSELGIEWDVDESKAIMSEKDKKQPLLSELPAYFHFEGND